MARATPFVFCRYSLSVDGEDLSSAGQRQIVKEGQGNEYQHGNGRGDKPAPRVLIMEPREFECDGNSCLTWCVGLRPGFRVQTEYDQRRERIYQRFIGDSHIKYARVVSIPDLGVMAIEDRTSDEHIPARQAIGAYRTIIRFLGDGVGALDVVHGDSADVQRWLGSWDLTEYSYTISPLNPISSTDLAERRSEAMKRENIARETGKVKPHEGQTMKPNDGIIAEANDLSQVGYGQRGFRGRTPDGHVGHVPKPAFHESRHKNLKEQEKQQFVRVLIDPDEDDNDQTAQVARALRRFYGD